MGPSARVTSIEALKDFRASLCRFGHDAKEAIGATELEIRRIFDWLDAQLKYWQKEVRIREEDVARAKAELIQRQYGQRDGRGPGTTDQEIALQRRPATPAGSRSQSRENPAMAKPPAPCCGGVRRAGATTAGHARRRPGARAGHPRPENRRAGCVSEDRRAVRSECANEIEDSAFSE